MITSNCLRAREGNPHILRLRQLLGYFLLNTPSICSIAIVVDPHTIYCILLGWSSNQRAFQSALWGWSSKYCAVQCLFWGRSSKYCTFPRIFWGRPSKYPAFKTIFPPKRTLQKCSEFRTKHGANLACILTYFSCALFTRAHSVFLP